MEMMKDCNMPIPKTKEEWEKYKKMVEFYKEQERKYGIVTEYA